MEASPDGPCEAVVRAHLALNLAPQARRLVRQHAQRALRPRPRVRVRVFPVRAQSRSRSNRALQQRPQAHQVLRRVHHLHFEFASSTGMMIALMIMIALLRGGGGGGGGTSEETGQDEKVEEGLGVGVKDGERVARVGKVDRRREGARLQGRVVQSRVGA